MSTTKPCPVCHAEFTSSFHKKYCSLKCKNHEKYRLQAIHRAAKSAPLATARCVCGAEYTMTRANKRFCSPACQLEAKNKRSGAKRRVPAELRKKPGVKPGTKRPKPAQAQPAAPKPEAPKKAAQPWKHQTPANRAGQARERDQALQARIDALVEADQARKAAGIEPPPGATERLSAHHHTKGNQE